MRPTPFGSSVCVMSARYRTSHYWLTSSSAQPRIQACAAFASLGGAYAAQFQLNCDDFSGGCRSDCRFLTCSWSGSRRCNGTAV